MQSFVFTGQGSQKVGMLGEHFTQFPLVADTFNQAASALDYDLWQVVSEGPKEKLDNTVFTQPALLTASVALWRTWCDIKDAHPKLLAGHSLGEYSALVAAGAIAFADAVKLVQFRAQCMQQAVPEGVGAMAAILGLDDDAVASACAEAAQGEVVEPANFNSPGQIVIAGHTAAVERATVQAKALGAKRALPLPVSVPSHCSLMLEAGDAFASALNSVEIREPKIPVLHNVNADFCQHPDDIREALAKQLSQPVQWTKTVERLRDEGVSSYVECGPGKVLLGLIKRIDKAAELVALDDPASFS